MSEETVRRLLFNSNAITWSERGGSLWALFMTYWIK